MTAAGDGLPDGGWFDAVARGSGIVFFRLRIAPDFAYEYISDAVEGLLGVPVAEAMADPTAVMRRLDPRHADRGEAVLALRPGEELQAEMAMLRDDGVPLSVRVWTSCRLREDGSVVHEGTVRDITALSEAQHELRLSEKRHRLLAENAWDVIWTMALDGTITYVSPAVLRVRGITPEEAMSQTLEQIHPPESAARVMDYFGQLYAAIAAGTEPPVFRGEQEYYRKDGSIMIGELQVIPHVDADGTVVEILGVTRDVSERKELEAELTRLAVTDPLTGAWNRRHGEELLQADVDLARRHGNRLTALMLDIDHFKEVNDSFGHQFGDRVLLQVVEAITSALRSSDVLIRWGGEEFVVLLRHCGRDDALPRAEELRGLVGRIVVEGHGPVSISIGVTELAPDDTVATWLDRADAAMYDAKKAGRNTVAARR